MPQNDPGALPDVWLVGAGPGDAELLTRKAARLIAEADIILHDALIGPDVLALARADARMISVGKRSGRHSRAQHSINDLLLDAARTGLRVVRLKGGDPSIFGRSAEEMAHLAAAGIRCRICPGITAASAAAATGLVSLTQRGVARTISFATAHWKEGEPLGLDWTALAGLGGTIGIYMGRAAAPHIARELIAAGCAPDTPVLVAVNVSLPGERLIRGRLDALGFLVKAISDEDPTLLLIGDAVADQRKDCGSMSTTTRTEAVGFSRDSQSRR